MKFILCIFSILITSFVYSIKTQRDDPGQNIISFQDSLILAKYIAELEKEYIEIDYTISREEIQQILSESRTNISDGVVVYSADSTFKIFTIEVEGCGAYCNSTWYSWIHYNLASSLEINRTIDVANVLSIHNLPDKKYLIIEESGGRPASVMTVYCQAANLISFSKDSMISHPILYHEEQQFGFCQENGVEMEDPPYIRYDESQKVMSYFYGNNYAYSLGLDIDTIFQGKFNYINGNFILESEKVIVNNREENK